ncbi:dynamin family protein [Lihuaxuella thermophila]|uniref:Small GTP-binding protein domain-containing protein n=1 Tax=Lihuaxuella thermophila TaxID=1173111 RepID=A0A1H8EM80_9BACL|nr:dynamin family protein [Lihuaxuella thermophila]SEN20681.1 small GTP-binding protein domain-containing protein [Lihuaxuella thermophila]
MIEKLHSTLIHTLAQVYREMDRQGDEVNRAKLLDLMQKTHKHECMIAFCGHFSAGKSTMLNELLGEDILPTSPIPTSANVVKIEAGDDRVTLLLSSGESHTYAGNYTKEELKELCKNGEEVIAVHVYTSKSPLPEGVVFLDTPGIDSTDDAHRIATESALHLADVIFYVMDYNHVQSEVNLQFVKELKKRRKKVYLVINQIDKHRDAELAFEQYQQSVQRSFASWEIEVDGIFYTSLRQPHHPFNEFRKLEQFLESLIREREELIQTSALAEAAYLIGEHLTSLRERNRETIEKWLNELNGQLPPQEEIEQTLDSLRQAQQEMHNRLNKIETAYKQEIESILKNAYLMPYDVRELAGLYLETVKSDFKVGFFFSRAKTEKEKERRASAFYEKLKQTVETQIDVHFKQFLIQFLKQHDLYTEAFAENIYSCGALLEPAIISKVVKAGAGLTGNYLLTYAEDLANEIKRLYRQQANAFFASIGQKLEERLMDERERMEEKLRRYEQYLKVTRDIALVNEQLDGYEEHLNDLLHGRKEVHAPAEIEEFLENRKPVQLSKERFTSSLKSNVSRQESEVSDEEKAGSAREAGDLTSRIKRTLNHVEVCENLMGDLQGLQRIRTELMEKRQRAETKQFTVALFGAFSAGKSSFANALIGEQLLPVSPNPTTATINKVCPPTDGHPHGQVVIRFKTRETLFRDLKQVYKLFEQEPASLEEAVQGIHHLSFGSAPAERQKTALPFLQAVQKGFAAFAGLLGEQLILGVDEFADYVANEEKSCFVESVELYYDCPLTRQGVTLVDTPGANSIHARHTEVAFRYIKNADACFFVTYYNHPFSRADREFLLQLGRVKDTFALDKMFFIINAADLASSPEELQAVKQYIKEQLLEYGIRNPRLFAVSSLLALAEKKGEKPDGHSGLRVFEQAFSSFMMKDLMLVSLNSMKSDLHRAVRVLSSIIEAARQGNEEKQRKKEQYEREKARVLQSIHEYDPRSEELALEQEINELLYYVKQRLFFRYHDIFTEIFNPSALREDGGDVKQKLKACVMEMADFMQHDLLQEMRATSLRIEKWLNDKGDTHLQTMADRCKKIDHELPLSLKLNDSFRQLEFKDPFQDLTVQSFKSAIAVFKSTKSFFEKNDKTRMQEEMKKVLEPAVACYLEQEQKRFFGHYQQEWRLMTEQMKEKLKSDCEHYYESIFLACSEKADPAVYEEAAAKIKQKIGEMEKEMEQL